MTARNTKQLVPFEQPDHLSDIILVVGERKIHFNKAVLSLCSPVFDRMLNGDFAEAALKEIPLPGKNYHQIVVFLQLIHPAFAHSTDVNDDNLLSLLSLSKEYQVDGIRIRCEQYIQIQTERGLHNSLSADRVLLYLYACDLHDLKKSLPQLKHLATRIKSRAFSSSRFSQFAATQSCVEALLSRGSNADKMFTEIEDFLDKTSQLCSWVDNQNLTYTRYVQDVQAKLKSIREEMEKLHFAKIQIDKVK